MYENYTPLFLAQRGTFGLLFWCLNFWLAFEYQAEEPAQEQEDQYDRNGDGDQYRYDQQNKGDEEIHEALPEVDEVLNRITRHALRLPSADLDRLDGLFGDDVNRYR